MPKSLKSIVLKLSLCFIFVTTYAPHLYAKGSYGIATYYIRLDVKSSNNRITNTQLTMIPAEKDFRPEIFSRISISHVIQASPQETSQRLEDLIKKNTFMRILEQHGLKSAKTLNQDTIISYEGLVHTPISLRITPYDHTRGGYPYMAEVYFAPLSFPDQWESLKDGFRVKEILNDFILLFK